MARSDRQSARTAATRVKLLQAGLDLLSEQSTDSLFEATSARRVIAKAGSSAGAYYHHFDGHDSYVDELLTYSLEQTPVPEQVASAAAFEASIERGEPFHKAVVAGGGAALAFAETDPTWAVQLLVRAKASRNADATARIGRMYELVTEVMSAYYAEVIGRSSRELRPPFTMRQLVVGVLALAEGCYMRRAISPDDVPDATLGEGMVALLELYTRPAGETEDAQEWLDQRSGCWPVTANTPGV